MRQYLILAAAAVVLSSGAAVAQPYGPGYYPYRHHVWRHWGYRGNVGYHSWGLHHGRNPSRSAANGQ